MEKIAWDGPKWGREVLFPANPDLADILGDTDFDFEDFDFDTYWPVSACRPAFDPYPDHRGKARV